MCATVCTPEIVAANKSRTGQTEVRPNLEDRRGSDHDLQPGILAGWRRHTHCPCLQPRGPGAGHQGDMEGWVSTVVSGFRYDPYPLCSKWWALFGPILPQAVCGR